MSKKRDVLIKALNENLGTNYTEEEIENLASKDMSIIELDVDKWLQFQLREFYNNSSI